jgi:hypothetical protein
MSGQKVAYGSESEGSSSLSGLASNNQPLDRASPVLPFLAFDNPSHLPNTYDFTQEWTST